MVEFETLFKNSNGQKIIYNSKELVLIDRVTLNSNSSLKLIFEEVNSQWRQGVVLETKGYFIIDGHKFKNSIVLWQDTAPQEVNINVDTKTKEIIIYNVWDVGNGITHYWHNGAAMYIEHTHKERQYFCNDGYPDDDLNDLIFKLVINE
jgi:hypothetical protein